MKKAISLLFTITLASVLGACAGSQQEQSSAFLDDESVTVRVFTPLIGSCEDNRNLSLKGGPIYKGSAGGGEYASTRMGSAGGGFVYISAKRLDGSAGGGEMSINFATEADTCGFYTVEVSGSCYDCDSVFLNVGDVELAASVDENDEFSFTYETEQLEDLTLSPMNF